MGRSATAKKKCPGIDVRNKWRYTSAVLYAFIVFSRIKVNLLFLLLNVMKVKYNEMKKGRENSKKYVTWPVLGTQIVLG